MRKYLIITVVLWALVGAVFAVRGATLVWDSPLGYTYHVRVSYQSNGIANWVYLTVNTQAVLQLGDAPLWAAVTAIDSEGAESEPFAWVPFTNSVSSWTNPIVQLVLTVRKSATGYTLDMSPDLSNWKLFTNVIDMQGSVMFFRLRYTSLETVVDSSHRRTASLVPTRTLMGRPLRPSAKKAGQL